VYYPAANPNLTLIAATMMASKPDVAAVTHVDNEGQCTDFIRALRSAGFTKTVFATTCTGFLSQLGSQAGDVVIESDVWLPQAASFAPAQIQQNLKAAESYIHAADTKNVAGYYTYGAFSQFVSFAQALNAKKAELTNAGVIKTLLGLKNFQSFLGPKLTCNRTAWPKSATCINQVLSMGTQGNGTLKPIGSDGFTTVKISLLPGS
jgi:branched-chain amino acid transport system substrate-binding protein